MIKTVIFFIVLNVFPWHAFSSNSKLDLEPFELDDYLNGTFQDKGWNGTWVSDSEFIFRENNSVYKIDVNQNPIQRKLFLETKIFADYPDSSISLSKDLKYVILKYNVKAIFRHSVTAQYTIYDIEQKQYHHLHNKTHLQYATWAPIGDGLAYVFDNNIYYIPNIKNLKTPRQITTNGIPGVIYNGVPDWVYEEEVLGTGSALWFSPNGNRLVFVHFNDTLVSDFHYIVYGDSKDLYTTLVTLKYPKPGTTNPSIYVKYVELENENSQVIDISNIIPIDIVTKDHVLQDIRWATNSEVVALSLNRVQNVSAIVRCNVITNNCTNVHTYAVLNGWVELHTPIYNSNGTKFLMLLSETEGNDKFKHLSISVDDQSQRRRLTYGKRVVTNIYGWNEDSGLIYYAGTVEGDHAQQHVYEFNLTSNTDLCLTCHMFTPEGPCEVATASFSKKLSYFTKTCSGPGPKIVQVQNLKDSSWFTWENNSELRQRLQKKYRPIRKSLTVPLSSGYTAHVRLLLPPNIAVYEDIKYPMIVNVYAGPNSNQISNSYSAGEENYFVTNRNYIYAFIDARGSGKNGDNLMYQIYKRLGTIEMEDQIEVTKYLQNRYPFIDSSKTGVWGWSYGGFSTLSILGKDTENVFKWGLAVAPVTNFALYDSIYTERYMGLPTQNDNLEGYNRTDISRSVEAFRNKTFYIIHGNADDNVHYQHSMILAKVLQRADIMYFQQSYPDENHGIGSVRPHLYHTIDKFFDHGFRTERHGKRWKITKRKYNYYKLT